MLITTVQRVNVLERAFRQWFINMLNIDEREISEKKKENQLSTDNQSMDLWFHG